MITVVLEGGRHSHEHFRFDRKPTRVLVQTSEGGGMYGREGNRASIYQDTGRVEDGCHVFTFVRTAQRILDGLVEAEYA